MSNGNMLRYQHLDPDTGAANWSANPPTIGFAWQPGKPVAAPDGVIFAPWTGGELRRYRWNGAGWDTFPNGTQHEVIDTGGWDRYLTADYRNRITVDTDGFIYTIEPDGALHWRSFDAATHTWTHRVIASGWNQYNLIIAAGRGVLFARNAAGNLYRYRYDAASQRWLTTAQPVGLGWQAFDRILSAGADVLYTIKPDGTMYWWRWDENAQGWTASHGAQIGAGWIDSATTAAPDTCQVNGVVNPVRPTVPAVDNPPVTLQYSTNGDIHYSYVDSESRAVYAEATDVTGSTPIGFAVVPGFTGVIGITGTGDYQDGRIQLAATGTDAEVRTNVQTVSRGPWAGTTTYGGFVPSSASIVHRSDNTIAMFALDAAGDLWARSQAISNASLDAWTRVGPTPLKPGPITVAVTANGIRILGLGQDGTYHAATYTTTLSAWVSLGSTGFDGTISAVVMPDNTLQVFANNGGAIQTQRETTTGFAGTWTSLPGVIATGSPSAIMSPAGTLQVVARADDDYVYYAGQAAPGSAVYTDWREITNYTDQTSTSPVALAVPDENTWVVGYRNDLDTPKLRRYQSPALRTATPFVDVPLTPPSS
ncbi:tachylectin-related carbohydrate-binding protein [Labedaea rhizosphaerae]|uniref:tachylectin-related carbohydrate-binding protein n=1 Tax=Labedaea rhizosphaerae TaxID=598644 RepID=UPI0014152D35|nr:tachylectin-related carbohydrate-binding protein [Labedaea rhizosphaerae]